MCILSMSFIIIMLTIILMLMSSLLSKKTHDREKLSPFECGFDNMSSPRIPFSIRFFLISILFLIFDVEITLILPTIMIMNLSNLLVWTITLISFIMILLFGLYHEWNQGMLNWTK